jgi:Pilus assembly protein, PilO
LKKPFSFLKTYKQHNYALAGVVVLLALLAYSTNIRRTFKTYQTYKQNKVRLIQAQSAAQDIARYRSLLRGMQQSAQRPYNREYLLEQITAFCRTSNLLIKTFPDAQKVKESNYPVVTNEIEVEGSYKNIVSLIYLIEQKDRLSSISSTSFYIVKDRVRQQNYLRCRLVLRNIET